MPSPPLAAVIVVLVQNVPAPLTITSAGNALTVNAASSLLTGAPQVEETSTR